MIIQLLNRFILFMNAIIFIILSLLTLPAYAIAYANGDDCSNNVCLHPDVVMFSGFDSAGNTSVGTRCSATLIQSPTPSNPKYVFLTAAHCVFAWLGGESTTMTQLGVSFDGNVSSANTNVDISHFAILNNPGLIINPNFGPNLKILTSNVVSDYAVVVMDAVDSDPILAHWPNLIPTLPTTKLAFDPSAGPLSLDALVASISNPQQNLFFNEVGYGIIQLLNPPGSGGNAGGPVASGLGTKRDSNSTAFLNLRSTLMNGSMNPAQGNNGGCGGDSGGPIYYTDPNLGEILVAVESSGDNQCRATSLMSRIDIPDAANFINCARTATSAAQAKNCGITSLPK